MKRFNAWRDSTALVVVALAAVALTSSPASAKTRPKPPFPASKSCYISEGGKATRVPCKKEKTPAKPTTPTTQTTTPTPKPKPTSTSTPTPTTAAYAGTWTGTITGTLSVTGGSSPYTQSYSDDSLFFIVSGNTLTSGGGAQSTIDANGDAMATYQISPYWNDGDVVPLVCTFDLHFSAAGTAKNVQPISCHETNPNDGEIATFTNGAVALRHS